MSKKPIKSLDDFNEHIKDIYEMDRSFNSYRLRAIIDQVLAAIFLTPNSLLPNGWQPYTGAPNQWSLTIDDLFRKSYSIIASHLLPGSIDSPVTDINNLCLFGQVQHKSELPMFACDFFAYIAADADLQHCQLQTSRIRSLAGQFFSAFKIITKFCSYPWLIHLTTKAVLYGIICYPRPEDIQKSTDTDAGTEKAPTDQMTTVKLAEYLSQLIDTKMFSAEETEIPTIDLEESKENQNETVMKTPTRRITRHFENKNLATPAQVASTNVLVAPRTQLKPLNVDYCRTIDVEVPITLKKEKKQRQASVLENKDDESHISIVSECEHNIEIAVETLHIFKLFSNLMTNKHTFNKISIESIRRRVKENIKQLIAMMTSALEIADSLHFDTHIRTHIFDKSVTVQRVIFTWATSRNCIKNSLVIIKNISCECLPEMSAEMQHAIVALQLAEFVSSGVYQRAITTIMQMGHNSIDTISNQMKSLSVNETCVDYGTTLRNVHALANQYTHMFTVPTYRLLNELILVFTYVKAIVEENYNDDDLRWEMWRLIEESTSVAVRQRCVIQEYTEQGRLPTRPSSPLICRDVNEAKELAQCMPDDWPTVNLHICVEPTDIIGCDKTRGKCLEGRVRSVAFLSRLDPTNTNAPIITTCSNTYTMLLHVNEMRDLLYKSNATLKITDSYEFWNSRSKLDKDLKRLCANIEESIGHFNAVLLLGNVLHRSSNMDLNSLIDNVLAQLIKWTNEDCSASPIGTSAHANLILSSIVSTLCNLKNYSLQYVQVNALLVHKCLSGNAANDDAKPAQNLKIRLKKLTSALEQMHKLLHRIEIAPRSPVIYSFDHIISTLPWEMIPSVKNSLQPSSRIFGAHILERQLRALEAKQKRDLVTGQKNKTTAIVKREKGFYFLDPGDEFILTQKTLGHVFGSVLKWQGVVAQSPERNVLTQALEHTDMFVYCGHGAMTKQIGASTVSRSRINAVAMLMGCSSVSTRLSETNYILEARSTSDEYTIGYCPTLIGCRWSITDREIDKLTLALFTAWMKLPEAEVEAILDNLKLDFKSLATVKPSKQLLTVLAAARKICKLPYLTGAACVAYGLPALLQG